MSAHDFARIDYEIGCLKSRVEHIEFFYIGQEDKQMLQKLYLKSMVWTHDRKIDSLRAVTLLLFLMLCATWIYIWFYL